MVCIDPVEPIITAVMSAMRFSFDPAGDCPPEGGGTTDIHFVSGEGPMWDPIVTMNDDACDDPFVWVRLAARYRTRVFPAPDMQVGCEGMTVVHLELGIGRCSPQSMLPIPDWALIASEAEVGRDDSWHLDKAVCAARALLPDQLIAAEPISPLGPDGGGIVWSTTIYVGIASDQE
jgi:hypothetical protein